MFVVKVYYKNEKSPWALTLTEPVPEAFKFPASDFSDKLYKELLFSVEFNLHHPII